MSNLMISRKRPLPAPLIRMNRPAASRRSSQKARFLLPKGVFPMIAANLLVTLAIALAGLVTYVLQKGHTVTLIWPAGGIALSALILKGTRVTPGIVLPLWISCLIGGEGPMFSLLAPAGTTAALLGGVHLLNRAGWNRRLSSARDVLLLLGLGGVIPMMASGFWTSLLLIMARTMPSGAFLPVAWLYGCANTAGTVILTPVILLAAEGRFRFLDRRDLPGSIIPLSSTILAAILAFGTHPGGEGSPVAVLAYLPFPFLVWTALTRGLPAAAASILGIITVAVAYTCRGIGPFASVSHLTGLWQYEVYIAILTSTGLLLGAGSEAHRRETSLREEALVREADLERIKSQIHPHFLFNSLNAIHSLIGSDPSGARGGILSLSRLLRTSLDSAREKLIPLDREMEIVRSYLELQRLRFEEGLETEIRVHGEAGEFPVAPMIIQPLVENGVKHGSPDSLNHVSVTATASGDWLVITITNLSAPGTDPSLWKEGVGLSSIRARIRETWGDRAELNFAATPSGRVTTSLRIPRN